LPAEPRPALQPITATIAAMESAPNSVFCRTTLTAELADLGIVESSLDRSRFAAEEHPAAPSGISTTSRSRASSCFPHRPGSPPSGRAPRSRLTWRCAGESDLGPRRQRCVNVAQSLKKRLQLTESVPHTDLSVAVGADAKAGATRSQRNVGKLWTRGGRRNRRSRGFSPYATPTLSTFGGADRRTRVEGISPICRSPLLRRNRCSQTITPTSPYICSAAL
jgi:hypothetical protein